jgi:RimJ/RimL family protein N-acetyltransferase
MFNTERLDYRILSDMDASALQTCLNTPEMAQAISFVTHPYTAEDAAKWVRKAQEGDANSTEWLFAVFLKDTQTYIGSINLHKTADHEAEIGYWIAAPHQGKGYAPEMLQGILQFGFALKNMKRIFATTSLTNTASQRLLEKGGFSRAGTEDVPTPGGMRKSCVFEIFRSA